MGAKVVFSEDVAKKEPEMKMIFGWFRYLCGKELKIRKEIVMEMMNVNAEFFRQLSYIADDENYMKKALKSIKKLVAEKERIASQSRDAEEEETGMSKAEILANFDVACKELKLHKEGKLSTRPLEDLLNEL